MREFETPIQKAKHKQDGVIPAITWIKNDPEKFNVFEDGSRFLVAIWVTNNKTKKSRWDLDVVRWNCDGESAHLEYDNGDSYDSWNWEDVEYFALIEGAMPTTWNSKHE